MNVDRYFSNACQAFLTQNYENAIKNAKTVSKGDEKYYAAKMISALSYYHCNQFNDCLKELCEFGIETKTKSPEIRVMLGMCYYMMKDRSKARIALCEALRLSNNECYFAYIILLLMDIEFLKYLLDLGIDKWDSFTRENIAAVREEINDILEILVKRFPTNPHSIFIFLYFAFCSFEIDLVEHFLKFDIVDYLPISLKEHVEYFADRCKIVRLTERVNNGEITDNNSLLDEIKKLEINTQQKSEILARRYLNAQIKMCELACKDETELINDRTGNLHYGHLSAEQSLFSAEFHSIIEDLKFVLSRIPTFGNGLYLYGYVLYLDRLFLEAEMTISNLCGLYPGMYEAWILYASILQQNHLIPALNAYRRGFKLLEVNLNGISFDEKISLLHNVASCFHLLKIEHHMFDINFIQYYKNCISKGLISSKYNLSLYYTNNNEEDKALQLLDEILITNKSYLEAKLKKLELQFKNHTLDSKQVQNILLKESENLLEENLYDYALIECFSLWIDLLNKDYKLIIQKGSDKAQQDKYKKLPPALKPYLNLVFAYAAYQGGHQRSLFYQNKKQSKLRKQFKEEYLSLYRYAYEKYFYQYEKFPGWNSTLGWIITVAQASLVSRSNNTMDICKQNLMEMEILLKKLRGFNSNDPYIQINLSLINLSLDRPQLGENLLMVLKSDQYVGKLDNDTRMYLVLALAKIYYRSKKFIRGIEILEENFELFIEENDKKASPIYTYNHGILSFYLALQTLVKNVRLKLNKKQISKLINTAVDLPLDSMSIEEMDKNLDFIANYFQIALDDFKDLSKRDFKDKFFMQLPMKLSEELIFDVLDIFNEALEDFKRIKPELSKKIINRESVRQDSVKKRLLKEEENQKELDLEKNEKAKEIERKLELARQIEQRLKETKPVNAKTTKEKEPSIENSFYLPENISTDMFSGRTIDDEMDFDDFNDLDEDFEETVTREHQPISNVNENMSNEEKQDEINPSKRQPKIIDDEDDFDE
eukprot:TRINITY_DN1615_c0_g1_i1.p1 TRINITY_DN1615_c0_g1~~TRINITY_DN1615_c0_g1_i1.p1  ORF type:complete len:995 (+),score=321.62 TRINITY_DN1615_c0_g1_i1:41-3025(+)